MNSLFWIFPLAGGALVGLGWLGYYLWEKYVLTPEERWRRRYDKRMKRYFDSMD